MNEENSKKLYRPVSKRMIGGVCAGLAEYMNTDANIVRIITALITLATGAFPGIITYFIAWMIIPEKE
jgi:phage shock protein C